MREPILITTTLPYANSTPHVGHCLEFVQADALARSLSKDHDVVFNIGLDEHGLKIYQVAQSQGIDTQKFVDEIALKWYDFTKLFQISYTNFYRTSDKLHHERVQEYWTKLIENGDIYKKQYHGKYCVGCEEFKTDTQLINDKCEFHPTLTLQDVSEENWFLKLTRYRDVILTYVNSKHDFLHPEQKKPELVNIIKNVEDISVSRRRDLLPWGVQVPNDHTQTIYVWFEALCNYLFAFGEKQWNDHKTIQLCGPDNLKFQALIWQGILRANKNAFTDHLIVHGTILDADGQKMSKSLGNVIDPVEEVTKYGLDAVRYYILKGLHTTRNSNWSSKDLVHLYNNDLANGLGNLIARTLHLVDKFQIKPDASQVEFDFSLVVMDTTNEFALIWEEFRISDAIDELHALVLYGNKYINDEKPWSNTNKDKVYKVLNNLYYLLEKIAPLYYPIIPESASKIKQALIDKKKAIIFERINE